MRYFQQMKTIIKLYNPLPDNIQVNDTLGYQQLQKSYIDRVILFEQLGEDETPFFSDPNFNIDLGENKEQVLSLKHGNLY